MEGDFSLLYSELNLPPDCTLDEFKRAYRRRIAQLHPDRNGVGASSSEAQAALAELLSTYVAVNRFHRRYGRMPGASFQPGAGDGPPAAAAPIVSRSSMPVPLPAADDRDRPSRPMVPLVILFIALLVLLAAWDWLTPGQ